MATAVQTVTKSGVFIAQDQTTPASRIPLALFLGVDGWSRPYRPESFGNGFVADAERASNRLVTHAELVEVDRFRRDGYVGRDIDVIDNRK